MCVSQKLPDSLTIDHRKEMQGFTRPSLLDPLRYFCVRWICEEFFEVSVHKMSASFQVFHFLSPLRFIDLSNLRALVCGGGPFKRDGAPNSVAWFRPIFCHALESSVSRSLFPVYVPDTVCTFRSSCRPVDRGMIFCFFAEPHFIAEYAVAFVTVPQSGIWFCRIGSTLGKFTMPVHLMPRACSHGVFFSL